MARCTSSSSDDPPTHLRCSTRGSRPSCLFAFLIADVNDVDGERDMFLACLLLFVALRKGSLEKEGIGRHIAGRSLR